MEEASRHAASQILTQASVLGWRVPCPPVLSAEGQNAVPVSLCKLRAAAVSTWPKPAPPVGERTEPLVCYVAALSVTVRQRPELRAHLKAEAAQCLQALAFIFGTQAATANQDRSVYALASARAAHLATETFTDARREVPWALEMPRLLDLQADALHAFQAAAAPGTGARNVAQLYERTLEGTPPAEGTLYDGYLRTGLAHWQAVVFVLAAPNPPTSQELQTCTASYLQGQWHLRERHYTAATTALETAVRKLARAELPKSPQSKELLVALRNRMNQAVAEGSRVSAERGTHDAKVGNYIDAPALVASTAEADLANLILPDPSDVPARLEERFQFDRALQNEMDLWSGTDAALSLTAAPAPPSPVRTLATVMARVLGCSEQTLMSTRALRSVDVWRAALVGALRQWLRSHAMGFGGVDREHKRQQVEQALRLLDYAQ
jgi:hypothetical protein